MTTAVLLLLRQFCYRPHSTVTTTTVLLLYLRPCHCRAANTKALLLLYRAPPCSDHACGAGHTTGLAGCAYRAPVDCGMDTSMAGSNLADAGLPGAKAGRLCGMAMSWDMARERWGMGTAWDMAWPAA